MQFFICTDIHHVYKKGSPNFFSAIIVKIVNFRQIWEVAAAINAEQCLLKLWALASESR